MVCKDYPKKGVTRYTEGLKTEDVPGSKFVEIIRFLGYCIDGRHWCARVGTLTDYSSSPNFYNAIIHPRKTKYAGAIHDVAYQTGVDCEGELITRRQADKAWYKIVRYAEGKNKRYRGNWIQSQLGYWGLRVGGWYTWNKYRKMEQEIR